eukprot:7216843-Alexandrium_andersonii.AAC.1
MGVGAATAGGGSARCAGGRRGGPGATRRRNEGAHAPGVNPPATPWSTPRETNTWREMNCSSFRAPSA